jgi:hypothetical protein
MVIAHQGTHTQHISKAKHLRDIATPTKFNRATENAEDGVAGLTPFKQHLPRREHTQGQAAGEGLHGLKQTGIHAR